MNKLEFKYIALSARKHLPDESGIYFICCRNKVLYIGCTKNLIHRMYYHHWDYCFEQFKNVYIVSFGQKDADMERELIKIYRPRFNDMNCGGRRAKYRFWNADAKDYFNPSLED